MFRFSVHSLSVSEGKNLEISCSGYKWGHCKLIRADDIFDKICVSLFLYFSTLHRPIPEKEHCKLSFLMLTRLDLVVEE